jgi:hypothetical protein
MSINQVFSGVGVSARAGFGEDLYINTSAVGATPPPPCLLKKIEEKAEFMA